MAVVIENDFQNTFASELTPHPDYEKLTAEEIVEIIKEAGITGMGGAGFPTHVKISSGIGKVDTLIVNGAECEPYITADHRLMLEQGERVIGGCRILMKALGLDKGLYRRGGQQARRHGPSEGSGWGPRTTLKVGALQHPLPPGRGKAAHPAHHRPGGAPRRAARPCGLRGVQCGHRRRRVRRGGGGQAPDPAHVTVTGGAVKGPDNCLAPLGTSFQHLIDEGRRLSRGARPGPHRRPHDGHCPV